VPCSGTLPTPPGGEHPLAKYLGGNGRKPTGISKRRFKKNLQKMRVLEDGKIVRRSVPVSLLRCGVIEKPVVRKPFTIE
jgi:large subunit ribosomal protein L28